jgi:hypothetical protein
MLDFMRPETGRIDHGEPVFSVNEPIVDAVVWLPRTLITYLYIYIGPGRRHTQFRFDGYVYCISLYLEASIHLLAVSHPLPWLQNTL